MLGQKSEKVLQTKFHFGRICNNISAGSDVMDDRSLDEFELTGERITYIYGLVRRAGKAGPTKAFKLFPPPEYLKHDQLKDAGIYDRLKDTVWWIEWCADGTFDQLRFIELLTLSVKVSEWAHLSRLVRDDNIRAMLTRVLRIEQTLRPATAVN